MFIRHADIFMTNYANGDPFDSEIIQKCIDLLLEKSMYKGTPK